MTIVIVKQDAFCLPCSQKLYHIVMIFVSGLHCLESWNWIKAFWRFRWYSKLSSSVAQVPHDMMHRRELAKYLN